MTERLLDPAIRPASPSTLLRVALLAGLACLIAAHIPGVWPHGRLWAEEGRVFLAGAWTLPWYEALTMVQVGYMILPASGAMTLAVHLVPLEYVPLVTVLVALLLQVVPAALLTVSGIPWLRDWRILALALLIITIPPFAEEVWLNTITSQFHIILAVALILASVPGSGWVAWFQGLILLLAPLTGPGGGMLLPLFVLRGLVNRSAPRLNQGLLMLPGALIQLFIVLTHPEPSRAVGANLPIVLAAITGKQILLPLLGTTESSLLSQSLYGMFAAGQVPVLAVLAPVAVFGALGLAVWRGRNAETRWLFAAAMVIMAVSYFAASTPGSPLYLLLVGFGNRYYFAPAALTGLVLLGVAATAQGAIRYAAMVMVAWLLVVGLVCYPHVAPGMAHGPDWRTEVEAWRADPTRPIAIWPDGWFVKLPQ